MVRTKSAFDTKARAWTRRVSLLGTLCGVCFMLVNTTGCNLGTTTPTCEEGAACDDGTACTSDDVCDANGACAGTEVVCDDGNECTDDTCDAEDGCTSTNNTAACDDGSVCTDGDACADGACAGAAIDGCCETDADCADGEECVNNACEVVVDLCADVVCDDDGNACTDETCDDATGDCVSTNNTAACDDADECTTDDTCADGACAGTAVACDAGFVCDPVTGGCVAECVAAIDCDDSDPCTDDVCNEGVCENTVTDVDNGVFCDGIETCDAGTGTVTSSGDPCLAGTSCNEVTDTCDIITSCTVDADCDDAVFCNGVETCDLTDPDNGVCSDGTGPCNADETCDEANDACDAPDGVTVPLTTSNDTDPATFKTGSGPDIFNANLFLTNGGNFILTLNNGDVLDGGDGSDTLNGQFNPAAATTTTPGMANIEIFNLEVTTGSVQTLNFVNAGSETTINFKNSATDGGDLMLTNVGLAPTNVGLFNCTENYTLTTTDNALSGTTDTCTLTLEGVTLTGGEPTIVLQPATAAKSGYETVNIVAQGGATNSIQDLQQGNGNSLTTINVSGSANLDMNASGVDTSVTTFDASAATGDVDVLVPGDGSAGTAISVKGGSGADELDCTDTADENFTVDAGAGDDKVTFSANYDSTSPFTDSVDGGADTDTLVVVSADATTTTVQSNVSNFETLQVSDALAGNIEPATNWGAGITKLTLAAGIDGTARTITLPTGGTLDMNADAGAATHVLVVSGTGTSDAVTLDLAAGVDFPNPLTVTGIETLTIAGPSTAGVKNDFGNTVILTASAGGSTKITITGANEVEFSGAITAGIIDGSAATGTIDMQATMAGASSILGGTAADNLAGSNANDVLSGGEGADTIDGNDGEDTLTGGPGADTFTFAASDQSAAPSATIFTTIMDFESDLDIIAAQGANLTISSGTTGFAAGTASISAEGFCTFNAADDTLLERITAAEAGMNANGAFAAGQFALFTHSTHTYLFVSGTTDGVDNTDLLFQLNGVTGLTNTTLTAGDLTIK